MESRTTAVFALIAAIIVAALAAGALVANLDLEKAADVPELVEKPELPEWRLAPYRTSPSIRQARNARRPFSGFCSLALHWRTWKSLDSERGSRHCSDWKAYPTSNGSGWKSTATGSGLISTAISSLRSCCVAWTSSPVAGHRPGRQRISLGNEPVCNARE